MSKSYKSRAIRICLITTDRIVESAVHVYFPPPHEIEVFSGASIVDHTQSLSEHGKRIVHAAMVSDVLLIDWNFDQSPDLNTLCYQVRRSAKTPVLALIKGSSEEYIAAIAAGADDAVSFPLYASWVQAKIVSYHRLVTAAREAYHVPEQRGVPIQVDQRTNRTGLRFGDLYLDRASHQFYIRDKEVEVTPREFTLLDYLIQNANTACTRDEILNRVWGINFDTGTNMVDVYMYFLRRKLEAHGLKGMIQTVRGYGYRMELPEKSEQPGQ